MASIINATTTNGVAVQGDNSGSLQLQTNNGTAAVTIDTSQNVGIGTTSPSDTSLFTRALDLNGTSGAAFYARTNGSSTNYTLFGNFGSDGYINNRAAGNFLFYNSNTERMRIDSSGRVGINTTDPSSARFTVKQQTGVRIVRLESVDAGTVDAIQFVKLSGGAAEVGTIQTSTTATTYNTTSDYRLKENVAPMTGALAKVAQLKPCTYTWKSNGESCQGFIAHELQAVVPECVTGSKDAVDLDGNPKYQGIDTSFLVATLTAAIQELKAELDATKAEVQALKGAA